MTTIVGIDPGIRGAFALVRDGMLSEVHDLPVQARKVSSRMRSEIDAYELSRLIDAAGHIAHAFIEQVGPRATDGAIQAAAFLGAAREVRGVIKAHFIPVTEVAPVRWRNALRIPKPPAPGDKSLVVARANELFPAHARQWTAKCHADRAEAALIAFYGWRETCVLQVSGETLP